MMTMLKLGRYGRFGNQMFQIAGIIGVARRSRQEFCFPEWKNWDALERFATDEDIDVQKYFVNPLPSIPEGISFQERTYTFGLHHIVLPEGNWDLSSHFQSPKYFEHCIDEVRHYLTMKQEKEDMPFTAIHFRGGDYSENKESYHPRLTMAYYEKAISLIPGPYMIFSDEPETAMQMFGLADNAVFVEGNDYITDFALMKRCKNHIIANSSFSLMAAILANQEGKKVCAPRNWFGPAWGSGYREMSKDVYGEGWTVI